MKIDILNRYTKQVIYSVEADSWRVAVEQAVKSGAYLARADLYGADLYGANLSGANLYGADLSGADLSGADLSGAYLYGANLSGAYLARANLARADLSGANLYRANLYRADLSGADLSGADLSGAYLSGANLYRADLYRADLSGATGIDKNRTTPLRILLEQPGPVWAYKLVRANGEGPFNGGINYLDKSKEEFSVSDFDNNESNQCGAGINLATLDWVMKEWRPGYRVLIMEFFVNEPPGNLCVPTCTDGKFRVKSCRRVGEKDLKELGLVK